MADASTGGGGLVGGAADPNQPKCFGCCCFMRCGVVVGEILCIVWFTLNLLLGIFGILGAIAPNDVARDAGLFCTLPDPVRAVYTDATCFGYDMCDCGGSICTEEAFAGQMAPGRVILPIVGWIISLVWVVNAIVGLIAVCKHRYPLLRIVGFWKIAMIVIALLGWVGTVATGSGGRAANHAADSYWRVAGAQQCAEWGSGLIPLENDLSGWGSDFDWDTAPTVAAQTCGGGGFGRRLQTDTGNWEPTARPTYNFLQSRRGTGRAPAAAAARGRRPGRHSADGGQRVPAQGWAAHRRVRDQGGPVRGPQRRHRAPHLHDHRLRHLLPHPDLSSRTSSTARSGCTGSLPSRSQGRGRLGVRDGRRRRDGRREARGDGDGRREAGDGDRRRQARRDGDRRRGGVSKVKREPDP